MKMGDEARAEVLRNNWAHDRRRVRGGWLSRAASSEQQQGRGVLWADGVGNSVVVLVFGAWAWSPSPESSTVSSPPVVSLHLFAVRAHIHMPAVA
jgi:hypothetical protein